jgi:hypothetical protein
VGDRVRVRADIGHTLACEELPHYPEEAGATGEVVADRARPGAPGHPYLVMFDSPPPNVAWRTTPVPLPARHYAADELEPLA